MTCHYPFQGFCNLSGTVIKRKKKKCQRCDFRPVPFGPTIHRSLNDDNLFSRHPLSLRAEFGIWERGWEGQRRALGLRLLHVPSGPTHTPQLVPQPRARPWHQELSCNKLGAQHRRSVYWPNGLRHPQYHHSTSEGRDSRLSGVRWCRTGPQSKSLPCRPP